MTNSTLDYLVKNGTIKSYSYGQVTGINPFSGDQAITIIFPNDEVLTIESKHGIECSWLTFN